MIKPAEFRPGSLIQSGKGIYRVYAVSARQVLAIQDYKEPIDSEQKVYPADNAIINPIPITEEWLVKLGFVNRENGWMRLVICEDFFYISWELLHGVCLSINFNSTSLVHIKYIHQLQNLIYALTGEELTENDLNK